MDIVRSVHDCSSSRRIPEDLIRRLKETAEGFRRAGAAYWPGADHFVLLEIDANGSSTGDGREICRACVREAARMVEARLDHPAGVALDLIGDTSHQDGPCCLCGFRPDC